MLITHNVAAVRYVADRVAVMYLGLLAEVGPVREVLDHPIHPYPKALLAALPLPDPRRRRARYRIGGEIPTLIHPPVGCRFAARCPFVIDRCRIEDPLLRELPQHPGRAVACHRAEEIGDVPPEELIAGLGLPHARDAGSIPLQAFLATAVFCVTTKGIAAPIGFETKPWRWVFTTWNCVGTTSHGTVALSYIMRVILAYSALAVLASVWVAASRTSVSIAGSL